MFYSLGAPDPRAQGNEEQPLSRGRETFTSPEPIVGNTREYAVTIFKNQVQEGKPNVPVTQRRLFEAGRRFHEFTAEFRRTDHTSVSTFPDSRFCFIPLEP